MTAKENLLNAAKQRALILATLGKGPMSAADLFLILLHAKLVRDDEYGKKRIYNLLFWMRENKQVTSSGTRGKLMYRLTGTEPSTAMVQQHEAQVITSDAKPADVSIAFDHATGKFRIEVRTPITLEFSGLKP